MGDGLEQHWDGRGHFFAAAAEPMRRILVDQARRKQSLKHGGGLERVDFTHLDVALVEDDATVLAVSEALERLSKEDPKCAELIKLRFFAGPVQRGSGAAVAHGRAHGGKSSRMPGLSTVEPGQCLRLP